MSEKVQVRAEVVTKWSFTVDDFIRTYHDEWEQDGKPDRIEWVRRSIEELGADQLDRVAPRSVAIDELDVVIR